MNDSSQIIRPLDDPEALRAAVRERYAAAARTVLDAQAPAITSGCCSPAPDSTVSCCGDQPAGGDVITRDLYDSLETGILPEAAVLASLGCGNPTALADLKPGETVLDLGSGGGIDVLLSAKRVGPNGFAYGLDMTDEMLALAEQNRERAGAQNVRFLKGTIEAVPLPDASVDVIISNCVINLSADKDRVLAEAARVLRSGGRFAVSDVVFTVPVPEALRRSIGAWSGCIGGALTVDEYQTKLQKVGFEQVAVEITRPYRAADLGETAAAWVAGLPSEQRNLANGGVGAAFVRARKPGQD